MSTDFTTDVIEKIGYYVYRLIDPRNGNTFYIGKGKGNRIFQHVKGAIDYFDGDYQIKLFSINDVTFNN